MSKYSTYTSAANSKLIDLFRGHGYEGIDLDMQKEMVIIEKVVQK